MEKQIQIKITIQPELHKKVKENAKENMRTMSGEINYMLNKAYNASTPASTTPASTTPASTTPASTPHKKRGIIDDYSTKTQIQTQTQTQVNDIKEEELINDPYYDPNF